LISITDGQIYLSPTLYELGVLPAVDVGKSVSRVGGQAQLPAYRGAVGDLKLAYSQFEELESFSRFGARLDEDTRKIIEHGGRIRACLKQPEFSPVPVDVQIAVLLTLGAALFDLVPIEKMKEAEQALRTAVGGLPSEVRDRLQSPEKLSPQDRESILKIARDSLVPFQLKPETKPESKPEDSKTTQPQPKGEPQVEDSKAGKTPPKIESKPGEAKETKTETKPADIKGAKIPPQEELQAKPSVGANPGPPPGPKAEQASSPKPPPETKLEPKPTDPMSVPAQAEPGKKP
jgi:F-type H+-transporting ATPase subunit alpha